MTYQNFCEKDGRGNPLLWLCEAKATIKIENGQPDLEPNYKFNFTKKFWRKGSPK